MKRKKLSSAIIKTGSAMIFCSIITGTMWAQGIPSVTNIPNAQYPMVNPDRTVTFKVKAPDAKSVQIVLDRPYEMQKDRTERGNSPLLRKCPVSTITRYK